MAIVTVSLQDIVSVAGFVLALATHLLGKKNTQAAKKLHWAAEAVAYAEKNFFGQGNTTLEDAALKYVEKQAPEVPWEEMRDMIRAVCARRKAAKTAPPAA